MCILRANCTEHSKIENNHRCSCIWVQTGGEGGFQTKSWGGREGESVVFAVADLVMGGWGSGTPSRRTSPCTAPTFVSFLYLFNKRTKTLSGFPAGPLRRYILSSYHARACGWVLLGNCGVTTSFYAILFRLDGELWLLHAYLIWIEVSGSGTERTSNKWIVECAATAAGEEEK